MTMEQAVAPAGVLRAEVGGFSSPGPKERNEDAFAAKLPVSQSAVVYKGIVACIADGVSCSDRAQQASITSVTQFIEDYYSTPDSWSVRKSAARVLTSLNSWLYFHGQQGSQRHNGLVTTFSAAVLKSNTVHLLHAGDSRIWCLRDGQLQLLTRDHAHANRGGKSFITRALGMDSHLEVDYSTELLEVGDLLLFTTDGVHEFLSPERLQQLLQQPCESLEQLAQYIVEQALAAGSDDNLSCLLLRVCELPQADVDEVHRQLTELVIPPVMDVGNRIDEFEVLRVLYSGTRSHLYLVKSSRNGRRFVLKAPSANFAEDPQYLEGFIREQWVGRRLNSPRVMKIHERPADSRFLYHLCDFVEGQTLRQWMIDHPQPALETVRNIADSIVRGVRVFQRMGMVHRDLKPENIMLTPQGEVVILDFGTVKVDGLEEIASPLEDEVPVGSVDYIAPEYLRGEAGVHQSDIFSIGVIVYEMLTGHLPYRTSAAQQRNPQRYQDWTYLSARSFRSDLPEWMDLALEKACAASLPARYSVMSEFMADLKTPNTSLLQTRHAAPLMQRNPVLFWQWVAGLLLVIVLLEAWWILR
ncbi:bifunctional protein-serine/threonine kinase/phosphatase [Pseudomaricurvus sp. HS19]|uniref:bifunctional protein-serine/threonine kinase/phosphatase n=1 Tax=Pseudomaricurvus sp. HS19 TaxID=2692626 RepID=UPI001928BDAA|nr:bifunctional protein-serine/threonine kinase/phosphatase [Pseudomaricurvus sp. HS19]